MRTSSISKRLAVASLMVPLLFTSACIGGDPGGEQSPSGSASSSGTLRVSSLDLQSRDVEVGSSITFPEYENKGNTKISVEKVGEVDGREWAQVVTTFSNGDTFRSRLYKLGQGSAFVPFIGSRLAIVLARADGDPDKRYTDGATNGKPSVKLGLSASSHQSLKLDRSPQTIKEIESTLKPGVSKYTFALNIPKIADGLAMPVRQIEGGDDSSLEVSCGLNGDRYGLGATTEMYTTDSVSIPVVGTCKLNTFEIVRGSSQRTDSVTLEVTRAGK